MKNEGKKALGRPFYPPKEILSKTSIPQANRYYVPNRDSKSTSWEIPNINKGDKGSDFQFLSIETGLG